MPTHLRGPCIPGAVVTSVLPSPRVWHPSLPGLSFLEGRASQSFLDLSDRSAASQGCVRKEWRKWFEFDKGVVGEGAPCQFCLRNLKTRGAMWIRP